MNFSSTRGHSLNAQFELNAPQATLLPRTNPALGHPTHQQSPPRIHPRSVTLFHTSAHSTPHWLTAARAAPRNLLPGARLPCANQLLTTHKRQTMHPLPPRRNPPAGPDKFCWQLWPREIRAAAPPSNPTARRAPQLVNWPASDVPSGSLAAGSAWFTARLTPSLLALCSELAPVSIRMFSSLTRP